MRHILVKQDDGTYRCERCFRTFAAETSLEKLIEEDICYGEEKFYVWQIDDNETGDKGVRLLDSWRKERGE